MANHSLPITNEAARERAIRWLMKAPLGLIMWLKEPTRTELQNSKMWAMLNDISRSEMQGLKYTAEEWKCVCMNACGWEVQFLQGLDGRPFAAGFRSSRLTTKQMATLIDFMQATGDQHGVQWKERQNYD